MQELCFLTNVSGEQWAAWVQAIGSIGAIGGSFWLARKFQLDELRRLDLQNKAQADLADQLQRGELKRLADDETRRDIRRCTLAVQSMRYMQATLEGLTLKHGDSALNAEQMAPIESSLKIPMETLAQIPLMEFPDHAVALELLNLSVLLRFTIDSGKSTEGITLRKNFEAVLPMFRSAIAECERYKAAAQARLIS